jgi:hypothetical protein
MNVVAECGEFVDLLSTKKKVLHYLNSGLILSHIL